MIHDTYIMLPVSHDTDFSRNPQFTKKKKAEQGVSNLPHRELPNSFPLAPKHPPGKTQSLNGTAEEKKIKTLPHVITYVTAEPM